MSTETSSIVPFVNCALVIQGAAVHAARPADRARVQQQLFRQRGLARVDVGEYADVADIHAFLQKYAEGSYESMSGR